MKQPILLIALLYTFAISDVAAQAPDRITYQTVVRDASGALVVNTAGILRLSVLQGGASGTAVYTETQTTQTDGNGLLHTTLGSGTVTLGQLDTIDWSAGPYFLKVEVGPEGGSYVEAGVSQLLSVPYVLYSNRTGHVPVSVSGSGDTVYIGKGYVVTKGARSANPPSFPSGYVDCGSPTAVVEVTNPLTGKTWMDRNLGASQVADSSSDANSYGDLYQWGRFADGHQCRGSDTTSTLSSSTTVGNNLFIVNSSDPYNWLSTPDDNLWQGVSGVNNPCPDGFRIPTEAEWETERGSWGMNNRDGAFASPLKLPVSGYRNYSSGDPFYVGSFGIYSSGSVSGSVARCLYFDSSGADLRSLFRAYGYAVRCLKNLSPPSPSYPVNYVHCFENGDTTDIVEVTNPLTGKTWMDRNLGASQVADSSSDANSYGDLYQWGRFADGHQCRGSDTTSTLSSSTTVGNNLFIVNSSDPYNWLSTPDDNLWQVVNGVNNPCPDGYRIPTAAEWETERKSWGISNLDGAFASPLKLPVSGSRLSSGDPFYVDLAGGYWSSSVSGSYARGLGFSSSDASVGYDSRASGYAVRCLKDLSPPSYSANYEHCFENGDTTDIVEVTNPQTGKTWMDRNLGASRAATAFDDADSYGDLYQWGRFADGHQCRNSGKTSTLSSSPTPGNNLFIVNNSSPADWLSTSDDNLWQGVSGVNNPCPGGYRIPTAAEWVNELGSWGTEDSNGAFASPLKLPVSGYRDNASGLPFSDGSFGVYWSSSVSGSNASRLGFGSSSAGMISRFRAYGNAVRCLKN